MTTNVQSMAYLMTETRSLANSKFYCLRARHCSLISDLCQPIHKVGVPCSSCSKVHIFRKDWLAVMYCTAAPLPDSDQLVLVSNLSTNMT